MAGPKSHVIWAPKAADDIDRLWDYLYDIAGQKVADTTLRDVRRAIAILRDFPFSGRSRSDLRPGLRSVTIGHYILFYRVSRTELEIARILDGRRDLESVISDDD